MCLLIFSIWFAVLSQIELIASTFSALLASVFFHLYLQGKERMPISISQIVVSLFDLKNENKSTG
jgi:hypothetical protein